MTSQNEPSDRPLRRLFSFKAFGVFCLLVFFFLLGVVFLPWDAQAPQDADLRFSPLPLAPVENAFTYFEAAGRKQMSYFSYPNEKPIRWTEAKLDYCIGSSYEQWDPVFADTVLAANAAIFKEVEAGLACEHYASPPIKDFNTPLPWLSDYKELVALLSLKSKRAQLSGDPAAAVLAATQGWRLGQLVTNEANCHLEWLIGIACQQIALVRLEELAADAATPAPVLRELLASLVGWDRQGPVRGYRQAMQGEYQYKRNLTAQLLCGELELVDVPQPFGRIPYALKNNMTATLMAAFFRNLIENADRPYAQINLDYPGKPKEPVEFLDQMRQIACPNSMGKTLFFMTSGLGHSLCKQCQIQATVAALRLKVALRLYEQQHGQLSADLGALVPEYLKEIPLDPYDGKPFRYSKPEKKVWVVGRDLVDDGGKPDEDAIMIDRRLGHDAVMPLGTREMKPNLVQPPAVEK